MTSEATSVEKLIRSKWFVYVVVFFLIIATTGLPYKFQIFKALLGLVIIVLYSIYLLRFLSRKMTLEMDGRYALYFFLYVFAVILSTIMGSLMGLSAPGGSGLYLLILYFIKVGVFLITIDMFKDQKEDVVKAFMIIGTFFAVHGILQFLLAGLGIIHGTDIRLV